MPGAFPVESGDGTQDDEEEFRDMDINSEDERDWESISPYRLGYDPKYFVDKRKDREGAAKRGKSADK